MLSSSTAGLDVVFLGAQSRLPDKVPSEGVDVDIEAGSEWSELNEAGSQSFRMPQQKPPPLYPFRAKRGWTGVHDPGAIVLPEDKLVSFPLTSVMGTVLPGRSSLPFLKLSYNIAKKRTDDQCLSVYPLWNDMNDESWQCSHQPLGAGLSNGASLAPDFHVILHSVDHMIRAMLNFCNCIWFSWSLLS